MGQASFSSFGNLLGKRSWMNSLSTAQNPQPTVHAHLPALKITNLPCTAPASSTTLLLATTGRARQRPDNRWRMRMCRQSTTGSDYLPPPAVQGPATSYQPGSSLSSPVPVAWHARRALDTVGRSQGKGKLAGCVIRGCSTWAPL